MRKQLKNIFFFLLLTLSYSINVDEIHISNYNDNRIESSTLHLDFIPTYKSSFLLNKYFPNHSDDFKVYGIMIDGSMRLPTYQLIPEKLYFNQGKEGTFSQLSYKNKKSEDYHNMGSISIKIICLIYIK